MHFTSRENTDSVKVIRETPGIIWWSRNESSDRLGTVFL